MASSIKSEGTPAPFDGIDWYFLIKLAEKHNVLLMIAPVLKKLTLPDEAAKLFKSLNNFYVARLTRQNIEASVILSGLESQNIRYIKLKGSHIKEYYPNELMRSFTDVDLCIDEENREKAGKILESMGYELKSSLDYHDEYEKDSFYIYELHTKVVSEQDKYKSVFDNPFEKAVAENENSSYKLKNEYLYLHLFFHLYKHFTNSGCGIRFFADFLVFREYVEDTDFEFVLSVLKKYKLTEFYKTLQNLLAYFFDGKPAEKSTEEIALYIFGNNTTGNWMLNMANFSFWDKLKYFSKIWFPSANTLKERYPVLKKAPVLLPFCWIKRGFKSLFVDRTSLKNHISEVKTLNGNEYRNIKKTRKLATKDK